MKEIIPKTFDPQSLEDKLYAEWENSGYFKPEVNMGKTPIYNAKESGKPFVISMPPPNVTGRLHIGHSLGLTIQDIMTRYHRLLGQPTLWVPGMDHAGIATQTVVDKALRKKGIDRKEIGREKFIEEVWKWKEEYGGIILEQTRKMGASCDWSRERFTFDEGLNDAVREAFVSMYNKGLIYKGKYVVNWCPRCQTAIADDEVEYCEQRAKLYYFKYDQNFPITIATTRPETKLGDTGVAVNPNDKRYQKYIGKTFEVSIDGVKRTIKVFSDRAVDMEFGTGAVGVTPAHSVIDWKMAQENDLPVITVIDEYGRMTDEAGSYKGMKAKDAAAKLVQYLKNNNLLEKEEDYSNNLSICYRCSTPIEPIPSKQWFVKMKPLAEKAKAAVKSGKIKILPKQFEKVYYYWMDNIRDWCISRQLWWGHQIPVWYCSCGEMVVSKTVPTKCPKCKNGTLKQDPDVLDTWFSSALWPFSTLGWPVTTKDLDYFFPTTVMETGKDILFFWVAKMVMMSLELTGQIPFETVYLHGVVRDDQNRKMSKSLGNILDPLDLIAKYGTDALRMALVIGSTPGQDLSIGEPKIKGYRNFSNKIWNASRFVLLRITGGDLKEGALGDEKIEGLEAFDKDCGMSGWTDADKEIWHKHREVIASVTKKLDQFKFSQAGEELYEYFWHVFCDWYIEESKKQLDDKKSSEHTKKLLIKLLSESLILLHPFAPFVTEAVWQELRKVYHGLPESIMIAKWPA